MPGADTVKVAVVTPPPQLNLAPVVVDDAVKVTLVVAQVNVAGGAMLALGAVIFCATVTEALLLQPVEGSVTVTVYGPGADTVLVVVVTPPPQLNVDPLVVDDAVMVTLVTAQVNTVGGAMLALGGVVVWLTATDDVPVQPLAGSVTVTVYVAGAETVFAAVVTPPPQLNAALLVVEEAVRVSLGVEQVNTTGADMLALGAVMF